MLGGDTKSVMDGDTGDGLMTSVRMSEIRMWRSHSHSGPGDTSSDDTKLIFV